MPNRAEVLPSSLPHTWPWVSSTAHSIALQTRLHVSTELLLLSAVLTACPKPLLFCSPSHADSAAQTTVLHNQLHHAGLLQRLLFTRFCHFSLSCYHQSEPRTKDVQNSSFFFFPFSSLGVSSHNAISKEQLPKSHQLCLPSPSALIKGEPIPSIQVLSLSPQSSQYLRNANLASLCNLLIHTLRPWGEVEIGERDLHSTELLPSNWRCLLATAGHASQAWLMDKPPGQP